MKRNSLYVLLLIIFTLTLTLSPSGFVKTTPDRQGRGKYEILNLVQDDYAWGADFGTSASPSGKAWESTIIPGTTTNSFPGTAQARWKSAKLYDNKQVTIQNTGANSLDFKLVIHDNANDTIGHEYPGYGPDAEGAGDPKTLAAGKAAWIAIPEPVYSIEIFLKSTVDDTPTTFDVLATGQIKN